VTDFKFTLLVPQGEVLKNGPIKTSAVDVKLECAFCPWTQTIRFNAKHVRLLADSHFRRNVDDRVCMKRS
jgi:hypothetical protein